MLWNKPASSASLFAGRRELDIGGLQRLRTPPIKAQFCTRTTSSRGNKTKHHRLFRLNSPRRGSTRREAAPSDAPPSEESAPSDEGTVVGRTEVPPWSDEVLINKKNQNMIHIWECSSVAALDTIPEEFRQVPHIAVVGRANVGKSSLLNHVLHCKAACKTSSAAGKTTSINMMLVNDAFVISDLPGYPSTYRVTDKRWDNHWTHLVDHYFQMGVRSEVDLRALLFLFASDWKVAPNDKKFMEQMREHGIPQMLILTKDDRVDGHEDRNRKANDIRRRMDWLGPHVHYRTDSTHPSSRKARKQVQRFIKSFVAATDRDECQEIIASAWGGRSRGAIPEGGGRAPQGGSDSPERAPNGVEGGSGD